MMTVFCFGTSRTVAASAVNTGQFSWQTTRIKAHSTQVGFSVERGQSFAAAYLGLYICCSYERRHGDPFSFCSYTFYMQLLSAHLVWKAGSRSTASQNLFLQPCLSETHNAVFLIIPLCPCQHSKVLHFICQWTHIFHQGRREKCFKVLFPCFQVCHFSLFSVFSLQPVRN